MSISVRHAFERRLGLFPVYFSDDGNLFSHTVWMDYPFAIPDHKVDFETDNLSVGWHLLSYNQPVSASSTYTSYLPRYANDEKIESWWSAQTGNSGEWWRIDLTKRPTVRAIQVNFADQDFTIKANPGSYVNYQYTIEISDNGETWSQLIDKMQNTADSPHELIVLDNPVQTRYIRIVNKKTMNGKFSLSGFRVFGTGEDGNGLPQEVTGFLVKRNKNDKRRFQLNWDKQTAATGYIVHWGVKENQLNNAIMVLGNQLDAGYFNRDSKYYFSIDAFNENGVTSGQTIVAGLKKTANNSLSVYPNPSTGIFQVELPAAGRLSVSDVSGRSYYSQFSNEIDTAIDASNYSKGIYILSFISGNEHYKIKLIKK
jgi:hypothetical protein